MTDVQAKLLELGRQLDGDIRFDSLHRALYATDASIYAETPLAVAFPASVGDLSKLLSAARQTRTPLIPRAGGTSLAGQVVGSGLVIDVGRHMNRIVRIDTEAHEATVQPGVIQSELNRVALGHGLVFGPDTSTANRAMIGGMIGNNACGSHSIVYGTTREHVKAARVLLADGTALRFEAWDAQRVADLMKRGDRLAQLLVGMEREVKAVRPLIAERFPRPEIRRRNMGYALDYLAETVLVDPDGAPLNLARFLCGSEGTLALIVEATVNLERAPAASGIVVAHFDSLRGALEATVRIAESQPSAVELVDRPLLELTKDQLEQRRNRFFVQGDPAAVLIVEFFGGSGDEVTEKKRALSHELVSSGAAYACVDIPDDKVGNVWALRRAGLGLLMGITGDRKAVAFVEDTAVWLADLPDYVQAFSAIMERHGLECVYYGHASVGELHLRPRLDLKRGEDVRKMEVIGAEVAELVASYRGALSGEHGDGRVRSPFLERVLGPELVEAFRRIKALWDPDGLLNPGKIVDPLPMRANLRAGIDRPTPSVETFFRFDRDGGLVRATERCNGAGACRKLDGAGGTMCPSYMATREEIHTTRGRANLMRTLLTSEDPEAALTSEELYQAMDLCLMCKGCKSECPASVDVARLKSEFLQHYWKKKRTPIGVRAIAHIAGLNRLAMWSPRLSNWLLNRTRLGRWLRRRLGMHPQRLFPPLSRTSMRRWFRRRGSGGDGSQGTVAIFVDEFTDAHDLAVGQAAVALLERLGYRVILPSHRDSGRPLLSKGFVKAAAKRARKNVSALLPLVESGIPILGLEPSAALSLVDEYPDLVPAAQREEALSVAGATVLIEDFLAAEAGKRDLAQFFDGQARDVLVHGHCHQKALAGTSGMLAALALPKGHRVRLIDAGCCGMAGSFGYEANHYDLSLQIAEARLMPAVRAAGEEVLIAAPGFSCRHQIADCTGRQALHPVQVLHMALQ